jgi:hypothetical protein
MSGCSPAALDALFSLVSDGSRPLLKIQEAARSIFDKEENRIMACFCAGCVLSDGIISGTLQPVACVNALWILFDLYRSEGPAQSPFLHTFLHVLKHCKSPPGMQFFIRFVALHVFPSNPKPLTIFHRHLINYPSEKFAANQCADKILLLDDAHTRLPLSPNVDVAELQRKSAQQLGPPRRLSSAAPALLHVPAPSDLSPTAAATAATPTPLPPMSLSLGFEAPFPRPPPPSLLISIRELRWLNPFPEPGFVFCNDMMSAAPLHPPCIIHPESSSSLTTPLHHHHPSSTPMPITQFTHHTPSAASCDTIHMYENDSATRLEVLLSRALRVQLSDTEQEAARLQLEVDAAKCRCCGLQAVLSCALCEVMMFAGMTCPAFSRQNGWAYSWKKTSNSLSPSCACSATTHHFLPILCR